MIAAVDNRYLLPHGSPLGPHLSALTLPDLFTLPPCGNTGSSVDTGVAAVDLILQGFAPP